jgi:hypothetical protein
MRFIMELKYLFKSPKCGWSGTENGERFARTVGDDATRLEPEI